MFFLNYSESHCFVALSFCHQEIILNNFAALEVQVSLCLMFYNKPTLFCLCDYFALAKQLLTDRFIKYNKTVSEKNKNNQKHQEC